MKTLATVAACAVALLLLSAVACGDGPADRFDQAPAAETPSGEAADVSCPSPELVERLRAVDSAWADGTFADEVRSLSGGGHTCEEVARAMVEVRELECSGADVGAPDGYDPLEGCNSE